MSRHALLHAHGKTVARDRLDHCGEIGEIPLAMSDGIKETVAPVCDGLALVHFRFAGHRKTPQTVLPLPWISFFYASRRKNKF